MGHGHKGPRALSLNAPFAPPLGWQGSFTENFTALAGCTPGSDGSSRALCVTAQAFDNDLDRSAVYRQTFADDKPLRCEADVFIAKYGDDDVTLISFDFAAQGFDYYSVAIILREGVVVLDNYREDDNGITLPDNSVDLIEAAKLQQGDWFRATIEASSTEAKATVRSYGEPAVSAATALGLNDLLVNPFFFSLGIPWVGPSGPLEFRYDNVVCTYQLADEP